MSISRALETTLRRRSPEFLTLKEQEEHSRKGLQAIYGYLAEKGIEFGWNEKLLQDSHETYFSFYQVPKCFYHQVLVPGFRETCEKVNYLVRPESYICEGDLRTLVGTIKWRGYGELRKDENQEQ